MGGYYVPKHHECHGWKKEPRERDFAKKSIGKLSEADTFPAVVFESAALLRGEEPVAWRAAPKNPQELDLKEAYHLRRRAEVEFDGAANMLSYALYAKIHGASSPVLQFWLGRVVDMAAKIESAYESKVLAYPFSLMNLTTEAFSLDTNPDLKSLVGRLSIITENMATASSRLMNPIAVKTEEVPPIVQSAEKEIKPDTNQSAAESVQRAEKVQEEARCRNHTLLILAFAITALFFAASSSMRLEKRH